MSTEAITSEEKAKRPFYEPGWYKDLSNDEYHGSFGYSSSHIKKLIDETPAHLLHSFGQKREPTPSMLLGTITHSLVFEPEKFTQQYAVMAKPNLRTNAGKIQLANFELANADKTIITGDHFEEASAMAASVLAHPMASLMVTDVVTESSVYWWYKTMDADDDTRFKIQTKVRPDAVHKLYPVIVDLKTVADGSYSGFQKAIQNFMYHVSAAMYLEGVNQCKPLLDEMRHYAYTKFVYVCVENTAPYLTSVYEMAPEYIDLGKIMYRRAMHILQDAQKNDWPGYPEDIRVIEPPPWANRPPIV